MSDSLQPHGLQGARLLCSWDFPARILGRIALSLFRGSSQTRDQTRGSCFGRWVLYHGATWEAQPTNEQIPHHERVSSEHESVFAMAARALQPQLLEVMVFLPEESHFCVWNMCVIGARLCPSPPHSSGGQCSHGLPVLCMPEIHRPVPGDSS